MDVAELVFLKDGESLLQVRLDRAEVCIGSNPTADVVVPDESVPEITALLIDRGARRFRLRDLTRGMVKVNAASLEGDEQDLNSGDLIQIGPYTLRFQLREAGDADRAQFGSESTRAFTVHTSVGDQKAEARLVYNGKKYKVVPGRPFNIGAADDNDLVVDKPFISGFHCRISNEGGHWLISDLHSTNGTKVNGLKIKEAELPLPATIKLGKELLNFDVPSEAEPTESPKAFRGMIAKGENMQEVFQLIARAANHNEAVLITGESGCGKELVARALHDESERGKGPFLALNCGALSSNVIEVELFGSVPGSFTGATNKVGAFEATSDGTLFLDEIGELPLDLQPKLLRALETKSIRRVGGNKEIPIKTRIISATHRNLEELVREGRFREDLLYRLFVLSIRLPPLRERREDIIALASHFLKSQSATPKALSDDAHEALLDYTWPGNIRELRNVIVRAMLTCSGDKITPGDLQFSHNAFTSRSKDARRSLRKHDEAEQQRLLEAIEKTGGNRAEAARLLGISKSTFHDRLKRYGVPLKFRR